MKYSITSFSATIFISVAMVFTFFLITLSVVFAQTDTTSLKEMSDDSVVNTNQQTDTNVKPTPTLFNKDSKDVQNSKMREIKAGTVNAQKIEVQKIDAVNAQKARIKRIEAEARELKTEVKDRSVDGTKSFLNNTRDNLKEKLQNSDRLQDSRLNNDERKQKLTDKRKDNVSRFFNNIKKKIDAAISRLEILAKRIESRIVKFEERGIDMSEARRLLEVAKGNIRDAIVSIENAIEEARKALATDLSRDTFGGAVSELKKAKEDLRKAHTTLVEVIRIMKTSIPNKQIDSNTNSDGVNLENTSNVETN